MASLTGDHRRGYSRRARQPGGTTDEIPETEAPPFVARTAKVWSIRPPRTMTGRWALNGRRRNGAHCVPRGRDGSGHASIPPPILPKAARPSHRWPTSRWPLRLHAQHESTVANHSEIKSQVFCVSTLETSAMRSRRFARRGQTSARRGRSKRAPAGEVVAAGGSASLGGVAAFGPPWGARHRGAVSV